MSQQTPKDIEQLVIRISPRNRDLVRRDISQALQSPFANIRVETFPYYYTNGEVKDTLCLKGTITCHYRNNQYNIPIEIWLQQDHPHVPPFAYVKPTSDMYVSTTSQDVKPDGTIILQYLRTWRHPTSDLSTLLKNMSEAFGRSPPVYSSPNQPTPYPLNPPSSMPMPMPMPMAMSTGTNVNINPQQGMSSIPSNTFNYSSSNRPGAAYPVNYHSTTAYPTTSTSTSMITGTMTQTIPQDVYRESLQTALFDKIRDRVNEFNHLSKGQIDSLKKTEQDLIDGENLIVKYIDNVQQQINQGQIYLRTLQEKIDQLNEVNKKISSNGQMSEEVQIREDALILPTPIYKQLFQSYAEEHSIQDLLFYLSEGLERRAIHLDVYLKHVRELSRRQFLLRATMRKCRQIAGLTVK